MRVLAADVAARFDGAAAHPAQGHVRPLSRVKPTMHKKVRTHTASTVYT